MGDEMEKFVEDWNEAEEGDYVKDKRENCLQVVHRKVKPRREAKRLAKEVKGKVWIDTPSTFAVLKPVTQNKCMERI